MSKSNGNGKQPKVVTLPVKGPSSPLPKATDMAAINAMDPKRILANIVLVLS